MFSNLGSIFVLPPRHAESADTRAEIRRHDPEQHKRNKKERESEPETFFDEEDTATISVPALAVFLDNFLSAQTAAGKNNNVHIEVSTTEGAAPSSPLSPAARAASAYAKADHVAKPDIPAPPPPADAPALSAEDLRLMHKVRQGVGVLIERNIAFLKIEKGESFLASLDASVEKTLKN